MTDSASTSIGTRTPPAPSSQVAEPDPSRLSALVDACPEPVCIVDAGWRFTYANAAFERMTNITVESLLGRAVWDVYPQLLGTPMELRLRDAMQQGRSTRLDFQGENGAYDIDVIPFSGGLAFITHDITELRRATEELRQKEERFRAILNTEPGCVLLLGPDGLVIDTNPAGLDLFEVVSYRDLIGSPVEPFVVSEDRQALRAATEEVFAGGSVTLTLHIVGARGTRRIVEHRAVPLRDGKGAIVAALSITTDLTARYEHEALLRRRAMQNAVLASLGALAAGDPDLDDLTRRAVDALCDTLGIPARAALELLRKHGLTDVPVSDRSAEGPSAGVKLEAEDADFVRSAAHLLASAMERRRAEDVLHEREDQLRQSQKMEAIGQLAGGVAHDFNNLLTIIMGSLDSIRRHLDAPEKGLDVARLRRLQDMAFHGAERASTLTSRLLAFARRQPLNPEPIDVDKLTTGLTDLLQRTLGERIALETVSTPGLWLAKADRAELESALVNIAINARDAMPDGGKLTIETANVWLDEDYVRGLVEPVPTGQYVMLAVADTGHGMDSETLDRVFEPFFTTKGVGKGTGLGLSQVYGFMRQSGGHIRIYSEPGAGTTIKLYLPREADPQARESRPQREVVADGGSETILVVEDHDGLREYSTSVLRELGYRVVEACEGGQALELLKTRQDVQLLFTDVVLPGLNGRQLADEALRLRPDLKVLFTTGYTRNAIVHNGRLDQGVDLISKPFTFADLAAKVRQILDR
jgi:PAS domain S-box-containing protein